jgi:hypothetical protein
LEMRKVLEEGDRVPRRLGAVEPRLDIAMRYSDLLIVESWRESCYCLGVHACGERVAAPEQ